MTVPSTGKRSIGRWWLGFVVLSNLALVGYLYYYQRPTGTVAGLPEPYVVLIALMAVVVGTNSVMAWLYMGKPDLREVFTQPEPTDVEGGK